MAYEKIASVLDYSIKSQRLCIPFSIVHNATPASKTNANDLPAALILALEGQTAAAAAVDSGTNFATPTDSTGVFGILLANVGKVKKVLKYEVVGLSSGTIVLTPEGASSTGVTISKNIAISADSSLDLSATDLSGVLCVDFIIAQ
jgi:hypothetical protein